MTETTKLQKLTNELISYVEVSLERYQVAKEKQEQPDFYHEVKPFADKVKLINDEWQELAKSWLQNARQKHIFTQQIDSAHDQLETISIQCFYPQTSKRNFLNLARSVQFVLDNVLNALRC
ncbi:YppE family protein [Bacillaceae bacterium Marseille-Q3522]|nr:YppE family protein [Bacillaceae bacterium Marseille-Q3522]